ncbi:MAG: ribonuclease III [Holosporales bacterium]|jgi:ribonuclease-3|nr:ribonuclease III [Holosporales bacterium]
MEQELGYVFKNKKLLKYALTHSSIKDNKFEFERLEFIGDRVLALSISLFLYNDYVHSNEGDMAKKLSSLVNAETCATVAISINLHNFIKTSNDNILRNNKTVLADAMEAIIGAIFLDSNFSSAKEVIIRLWGTFLSEAKISDPKTEIQEITQKNNGTIPKYILVSKTGPEHDPWFTVELVALDLKLKGYGKSKKLAEIDAARKILNILKV